MMYVFVVNPKTPGLKTTVKLDTPAWHTVALRMDSQEAALCQRTAMLQALSDISVNRTAMLRTLCCFGSAYGLAGRMDSPVL